MDANKLNEMVEAESQKIKGMAQQWQISGFPRSGALEMLNECADVLAFVKGFVMSTTDEAWADMIKSITTQDETAGSVNMPEENVQKKEDLVTL